MIVNPIEKLRAVRAELYKLTQHPMTSERSVAQARALLLLSDEELATVMTAAELTTPGFLDALRHSEQNKVVG